MTQEGSLPRALYRAEQVRALDRCAIEDQQIPGIRLMQRAGQAVFDYVCQRWPQAQSLSIWCGAGNNAGDGYIVAGLARRRGWQVQLVQVGDASKLKGDAKTAHDWAEQQGVVSCAFDAALEIQGEVIIDALLGTGLTGEVSVPYQQAIGVMNGAPQPVVAVDIPTGLDSDTGRILGCAIEAVATISFIGLKRGLMTGAGPAHCGVLVFDSLGVPKEVYKTIQPEVQRYDLLDLRQHFAPRARDAHKGKFGRVLVVGGNLGMGGAAIMAAQAAGRVGAGRIDLATRPEHVAAALTRCPEVMAHGVGSGQDLEPLMEGKEVIVLGPGLGTNAWSEQLLQVVLASDVPLVVDADALNLISDSGLQPSSRHNWLLTPHPGEAARMLGMSAAQIQADRFSAIRQLQQKFGGTVVLKGAGSLICSAPDSSIGLCSQGNPGMASGGMGDVLSGVLAGLVAQGFDLPLAAKFGVCLHAAAADEAAAQGGERGLLATDLLPHLRRLVNPESTEDV